MKTTFDLPEDLVHRAKIAAARASGASELITEDLNHGQNYDGVTVINPFMEKPKVEE